MLFVYIIALSLFFYLLFSFEAFGDKFFDLAIGDRLNSLLFEGDKLPTAPAKVYFLYI